MAELITEHAAGGRRISAGTCCTRPRRTQQGLRRRELRVFYGNRGCAARRNRARWKRGVRVVEASMGEQLGQNMSPAISAESKARHPTRAEPARGVSQSIGTLEWMSPIQQQALAKLSQYMLKLGHPDKGAITRAEDRSQRPARQCRACERIRIQPQHQQASARPIDRALNGA